MMLNYDFILYLTNELESERVSGKLKYEYSRADDENGPAEITVWNITLDDMDGGPCPVPRWLAKKIESVLDTELREYAEEQL